MMMNMTIFFFKKTLKTLQAAFHEAWEQLLPCARTFLPAAKAYLKKPLLRI